MAKKVNDLELSGARKERAAMRAKVRRLMAPHWIDSSHGSPQSAAFLVLEEMLDFILTRQARYDKAPGGLGRRRK